jgi:hypothetical protein
MTTGMIKNYKMKAALSFFIACYLTPLVIYKRGSFHFGWIDFCKTLWVIRCPFFWRLNICVE